MIIYLLSLPFHLKCAPPAYSKKSS